MTVRGGLVVTGAAAALVTLLAGCADKIADPAPVPAPPATSPTSTRATTGPGKAGPTPSTTTTTALPGMPTPVSVGASAVDASRLHSVDDLPAVFGCPSSVPPIRLPAQTVAADATAPPGALAPESIVCASALADKEALYLWYVPTAEAKLGALTSALDRARYVHAGPNWVAAGTLSAQMGSVGGEVYR